jgi:hypothetical protein
MSNTTLVQVLCTLHNVDDDDNGDGTEDDDVSASVGSGSECRASCMLPFFFLNADFPLTVSVSTFQECIGDQHI